MLLGPDWQSQAVLRGAAALTFARLGHVREAEKLAKCALQALRGRMNAYQRLSILVNIGEMASVLGQRTRAARLARRALKYVSDRDRLNDIGFVAELLDRAGLREEAHDLLDRELEAAFVVRHPWASRGTAGLLGEALIRVGRLGEGVAQLDGLSDRYGQLGSAQVRIAGALAQAGALDKAETIALAADGWYQADALERVAVAFAQKGMTQRAERAATAIAEERARALTLCRIAPLADPNAVRAAARQAAEARNPEALAVIAMRLALGGDLPGGRDLAHQALEIIRTLEEHKMVGPLGDLGRVLLTVGDAASVQLVDELLCQVHDPEYRPDGRLRLALALAEAGQGRRARAIIQQELPNVDQLEGFPLGRAVMLARIAFILSQAGARGEAVQRARQGLVALNKVAGSSSSRYEEKIERAQAIGVLAHSEQLDAALEAKEITFSEFAHAWTENGTGSMQRIRALPERARQQPPGASRALALACAASLYGKAGLGAPAYPLLVETLQIAHPVGRSTVLTVVEVCADLIAALDKGETLARLCDAIKETEMWWPSAEISR